MTAKNIHDNIQENPHKNRSRIDEERIYCHIYNKGVEKRIIFNDGQDYEVFLGYLKDYLTPANPESTKEVFTVNGRIFRGIPHQPKNHFNKVELIAYSLMPNHFHLLLHQKTRGSIESFIRSLCTRYSMYFNKKYKRTGAMFEGPYKSVQIKDVSALLFLTRYIHHTDGYSSYAEYLGLRVTSWIKPEVVLSFFDKSKNDSFKGVTGYKNFVENYELDQKEKKALEEIILESTSQHLESRIPELAGSQSSPETQPDSDLKSHPRIPEFIATTAVFLLLVGLGVRNINASISKSSKSSATPIQPGPTSSVSGVSSISPQKEEEEEIIPTITLVVKINDGAEYVNIRQEPTVRSEKIGEAKDGDIFEFVSVNSKWYEIKLHDGSIGFISKTYVEEVKESEETNN